MSEQVRTNATIIHSDCKFAMRKMVADGVKVDSIVCDPPYEIGFMNKSWDSTGIAYDKEVWELCLELLKPGGHLIAFSSNRTYDLMVRPIRMSGFEVRDMFSWLYGSNFPKSHNIGKALVKQKWLFESQDIYRCMYGADLPKFKMKDEERARLDNWEGWGSAFKSAHEPAAFVRKPLEKGLTLAQNVLRYSVGGINIAENRIGTEVIGINKLKDGASHFGAYNSNGYETKQSKGRWPSNVMHDGSNEVEELFPHTKSGKMGPNHTRHTDGSPNGIYGKFDENHPLKETIGDEGSASRFFYKAEPSMQDMNFYCAKTGKKERNFGLDDFEPKEWKDENAAVPNRAKRPFKPSKNNHPTVKPIKLMEHLVRLVTPPGGVVLDPFMGSGSTGIAAAKHGFNFIGIDMSEDFCKISAGRIKAWAEKDGVALDISQEVLAPMDVGKVIEQLNSFTVSSYAELLDDCRNEPDTSKSVEVLSHLLPHLRHLCEKKVVKADLWNSYEKGDVDRVWDFVADVETMLRELDIPEQTIESLGNLWTIFSIPSKTDLSQEQINILNDLQ